MPSPALDFTGTPHPTVAWIERGLTDGFRKVIFRDATCQYHVRVAELEALGVDPNANVNVFDPSMTYTEFRNAAMGMIR
jgi:hypothetical protein